MIRKVTRQTRWTTETEWCEAGALASGDRGESSGLPSMLTPR